MLRSSLHVAVAALTTLSVLSGAAAADHSRNRGDGAIRLQLGAGQFQNRGMPRIWIEMGQQGRRGGLVARNNVPFFQPFDRRAFQENDVFDATDRAAYRYDNLSERDRARARQLDDDLGRELESLRRDLARRGELRPTAPAPAILPPLREPDIEVTRLPDRPVQPAITAGNSAAIIEEEAVLGRIDLLGAPAQNQPVPGNAIATVSTADVEHHGPQAFAVIDDPEAAGLPPLDGGRTYYRLNSQVVIADEAAERALIVAALNQVLSR